MADLYGREISQLDSPAQFAAAVTPSDSGDLGVVSRALWIGEAGDVAVTTAGGSEVTFKGVSGLLPVRVRRVRETGTTAAEIVAVW